jgi:HipA-like C-terminal domain
MVTSIIDILKRGPATSAALQKACDLSQATVSRQLRALGDQIVRLGKGRATEYALTRNAFNAGDDIRLYAVDPHGNTVCVARLRPLAHGGFLVEATTGTPAILMGESGDGLYDDLPYFLEDLRPQGFLGRQVAQALSEQSDYPPDPRQWSSEQVGSYLVANGDDLPGNFKLGQQAIMRLPEPVSVTNRAHYSDIAESVLKGYRPGSSAGGEQPKFTAYTADRGHVIVKFSPAGSGEVARRWKDILLTEYHAAQTLSGANVGADIILHEAGDRLFLESRRFDRHGERGRLPMISLLMLDAEFTGIGNNWGRVISALAAKGLMSDEHAFDAIALHAFGHAINNSDMHLGNLSLGFDGNVFRLLPAYDMCSMGFAPTGTGEVRPYEFRYEVTVTDITPPPVTAGLNMAQLFWQQLAGDDRISAELMQFLGDTEPLHLLKQ